MLVVRYTVGGGVLIHCQSLNPNGALEQVDLHAEGPSTSGRIPCPVCRNGHLMEHNGVVLCSGCDLRMDLRVEGLTLDDIRWHSQLFPAVLHALLLM